MTARAAQPGRGHRGPLAGVVVVELCQNIAGPFATRILGDLGARVVKVERPGRGDDARGWGPPFCGDHSAIFAVSNAGKDNLLLDLGTAADRERLLALVAGADVAVASWRPGSLERLGLGADALRARNPALVTVTLSGFGSDGPLASQPGYDPLVQALTGIMSVTGEPAGPPVRVGTSVVDLGTGMWVAIAVLAALRERDRSGHGGHVDASLFETGLAWLGYQLTGYVASGHEPGRWGSAMESLVPYQAFAAADADLLVAAGNDRLWQRLCAVIERPDLADDPALERNAGRVAQRERVVGEVGRAIATRSAAEWSALLTAAGVPNGPILTVAQVAAHEQTAALGMLPPDGAGVPPVAGLPFRIDGWRPRPSGPAPGL